MGNSTSTRTHTRLNLYPCLRVWVLVGMGMGTHGLCGCQNPCRFRPRVPRESTRQGGDDPSRHIDSCLLTRQGGRTSLSRQFLFFDAAGRGQPSPLRRFAFVDMAGREKPSLSYQFAFFDAAGREEPPSCWFVCVGGRMSNGGGEHWQLGKGGRELELHTLQCT